MVCRDDRFAMRSDRAYTNQLRDLYANRGQMTMMMMMRLGACWVCVRSDVISVGQKTRYGISRLIAMQASVRGTVFPTILQA